jgi:hypothetical protein
MWKQLSTKAEAERNVLCKDLKGKTLFTAILCLYAATHREMTKSMLQEVAKSNEEPCEQRTPKRNPSGDQSTEAKKSKDTTSGSHEAGGKQRRSGQAGRPPPVNLTPATNLLELEKKLKGICEFWNSRSGTRVVTKEMADFLARKSYLLSTNLLGW